MEGGREQQAPPEGHPGKNLIKIPSYQEVFGTGATSSSSKPASYNPPLASSGGAAVSSSSSSLGSFSQDFSFLKSSEFYSPPPPPPQPTTTTPRYLILSSLYSSWPRLRRVRFPGAGRLRLAPPLSADAPEQERHSRQS